MFNPEHGELPPAAIPAIQAGHKLEAIKIVREQTGLSLAEAKELVERAAAHAPTGPSRAAQGREDRGMLRLITVLAILAALAAVLLSL